MSAEVSDKALIRSWHNSLDRLVGLCAGQNDFATRSELRAEADRLEALLNQIANSDATILGLESRALIAGVRADWEVALAFRQLEVKSMLNALALDGPSGLTPIDRLVLSEAGGSIDDNLDQYAPDEIVEEWRSLVWIYCELERYGDAFDVIDEIERFARAHAVLFNAKERRLAVRELAKS